MFTIPAFFAFFTFRALTPFHFVTGEINGGFVPDTQSLTGSRKSASLQPAIMMLPHPMASPHDHHYDAYSEFGPPPLPPPPPMANMRSHPNSPHGRRNGAMQYTPAAHMNNFQL